jgi:hypothetical protein
MLASLRSTSWPHILAGGLVGLLLWSEIFAAAVHAQPSETETYTLVLRDVPLRQALDELVATTQINLIYDSGLVGNQRIFCTSREASPEELLQCILRTVPLDYVRTSSGTYVLVDAIRKAPQYGRLAGRVVDEETGEPLPYAHVLLADASTGTATNEAGLFNFSALLPGPHQIVVTYMGYRMHAGRVWVPPDDDVHTRIALRPDPMVEEPIIITGLQQRLPSEGLGQSTRADDRVGAMGAMGTSDVARGAGTLVGVARQSPLADLHIQGGSTGEHQMQLDGIPVRNPVSLGQLLGAFSPLAIGRLTAHKAGFGAEHGSHIAGVIDVEHDVRRAGERIATVNADPVSVNGRVQQPIHLPGGVTGDVMVAARQSVWGLYREPALNDLLTEWNAVDAFLASRLLGRTVHAADLEPHRSQIGVTFSDMHTAARLHLDPFRTVYASGYRGTNEIGADYRSALLGTGDAARAITTEDRYDWSNQGGQVRMEWLMGARAIGTVRLHGSRHTSRYEYLAGAANPEARSVPDEDNAVNEVSAEAVLDYSPSSQHQVHAGLEAVRTASRFQADNAFIRPLGYEHATWRLAGHVQGERSFGLGTTLEWGTRLTYVPDRGTVYAEPRLAVRYDRAESRLGGYAVRVAGGLYRQFTNRYDLSSTGPTAVVPSIRFWLPVDPSVAPPTAYHIAADGLLMPATHWTISAEAYYKQQPRILSVDYATLVDDAEAGALRTERQADFVASGRGYAYGGGVRVKYEGPVFQGTLSYAFSRSQRQFPSRFGDELEVTPWNEPHRLALGAHVPVGRGFSTRLRWKGIWERRWAFRRAYYDYFSVGASFLAGSYRLDAPSAHALRPLYRLDAGLAYTKTWRGVHIDAQVQLINMLDRANTFDWSLSPTDEGLVRGERTLLDRRPVFSLTVGY